MLKKDRFHGIAVFTVFVFTFFTLTLEYSFGQEVDLLAAARELFKQGHPMDAVRVLDIYIVNTKGNPAELNNLAEAYYLLARIYHNAGEEKVMMENLIKALEAYSDIGAMESDPDFKMQLDMARKEWLESEAQRKAEELAASREKAKADAARPDVREKESPEWQYKKEKKFPWLLVILGIGVAAGLIVLGSASKKTKNYMLTVTVSPGVDGMPTIGKHPCSDGSIINYDYSLQPYYRDLVVTLDGAAVAASGSITMDRDHAISVSATPVSTLYTLTVNFGPGAVGAPSFSGAYAQGTVVKYSYTMKSGYKDLVVRLDDVKVAASGSVVMNGNRTLGALATPVGTSYMLTVNLGTGVTGTPSLSGHYASGEIVNYSYSLLYGYINLKVRYDDWSISPNGAFQMNGAHTLTITAAPFIPAH